MNRLAWVRCAALAVAVLTASSTRGELIVNGSFETSQPGIDGGAGRQVYVSGTNGDGITGWTLSGVGDVYLHRSPDLGDAIGSNFNSAQDGSVIWTSAAA